MQSYTVDNGRIWGTYRDINGQVVPSIEVDLYEYGTSTRRAFTTTDNKGFWGFTGVPIGTYSIKFRYKNTTADDTIEPVRIVQELSDLEKIKISQGNLVNNFSESRVKDGWIAHYGDYVELDQSVAKTEIVQINNEYALKVTNTSLVNPFYIASNFISIDDNTQLQVSIEAMMDSLSGASNLVTEVYVHFYDEDKNLQKKTKLYDLKTRQDNPNNPFYSSGTRAFDLPVMLTNNTDVKNKAITFVVGGNIPRKDFPVTDVSPDSSTWYGNYRPFGANFESTQRVRYVVINCYIQENSIQYFFNPTVTRIYGQKNETAHDELRGTNLLPNPTVTGTKRDYKEATGDDTNYQLITTTKDGNNITALDIGVNSFGSVELISPVKITPDSPYVFSESVKVVSGATQAGVINVSFSAFSDLDGNTATTLKVVNYSDGSVASSSSSWNPIKIFDTQTDSKNVWRDVKIWFVREGIAVTQVPKGENNYGQYIIIPDDVKSIKVRFEAPTDSSNTAYEQYIVNPSFMPISNYIFDELVGSVIPGKKIGRKYYADSATDRLKLIADDSDILDENGDLRKKAVDPNGVSVLDTVNRRLGSETDAPYIGIKGVIGGYFSTGPHAIVTDGATVSQLSSRGYIGLDNVDQFEIVAGTYNYVYITSGNQETDGSYLTNRIRYTGVDYAQKRLTGLSNFAYKESSSATWLSAIGSQPISNGSFAGRGSGDSGTLSPARIVMDTNTDNLLIFDANGYKKGDYRFDKVILPNTTQFLIYNGDGVAQYPINGVININMDAALSSDEGYGIRIQAKTTTDGASDGGVEIISVSFDLSNAASSDGLQAAIIGDLTSPHNAWDAAIFGQVLGSGKNLAGHFRGPIRCSDVIETKDLIYPKITVGGSNALRTFTVDINTLLNNLSLGYGTVGTRVGTSKGINGENTRAMVEWYVSYSEFGQPEDIDGDAPITVSVTTGTNIGAVSETVINKTLTNASGQIVVSIDTGSNLTASNPATIVYFHAKVGNDIFYVASGTINDII